MSKVRKAVIPAAGLGTRHFPASHAVKKELFPVVGPDGIARALMHYHILELLAAGTFTHEKSGSSPGRAPGSGT